MNRKKWITLVISVSFTLISFVGFTNYLVDPLWSFSHSNIFNKKQRYFDERQQKTNKLYFSGFDKYDSILIGSSRTATINQNDFVNMNLYNYSSNALTPSEYKGYINFAKELHKKDLKRIIIGADFFGSFTIKEKQIKEPTFYINNSKSSFYRYKMLFSKNAFLNSIKNIKLAIKTNRSYYDRDNIKYYPKVSENKRIATMDKNIKTRLYEFESNTYDINYKSYLEELKTENNNTKFTIYTPPISAKLLVSLLSNKDLMKQHERWLKEIISVFGEVHHFMSINSITSDLQNYPDAEHYYPYIGKLIGNKISGVKNSDIPNDFGIILNKNNIDNYINNLKIEVQKYDYK